MLKATFGISDKMPDPADIQSAGQWYFLNHISSSLIQFDYDNNSFTPLLAKNWKIDGDQYIFELRPDAKFSDGSEITSIDLKYSFMRIILLKTSSHFAPWEYIKGADSVKSLSDEFPGIKIIDNKTVSFTLTSKRSSFMLQMASPEGGIWHHEDIDPVTLKLRPSIRRYSGPYFISNELPSKKIHLSINTFSPLFKENPDMPDSIDLLALSRKNAEDMMISKELDVFIGDYIPYNKYDWNQLGFGVHLTTPSSILYFYRLKSGTDPIVDSKLIEAIWGNRKEKGLVPAETFLPFGSMGAINKTDYIESMPTEIKIRTKTVKVAVPNIYFTEEFLNEIIESSKLVGVNLIIDRLPMSEYLDLPKKENSGYDFMLSTYVASERYPAVQFRYILEEHIPKFSKELEEIDNPEMYFKQKEIFADFQIKLIKTQTILPLFFVRTNIVYQNNIDILDCHTL